MLSPHCHRRRAMIAAGLALACPVAGKAEAPRVLRMGYLFARGSQLDAGTTVFQRHIERMHSDELRIEAYPGAALGGEVETVRGLRQGSIDLGFVTSAALASLDRRFGVLDVPYLFRDAAHAHAVLDGPVGNELLAIFAEHGLRGLAWGENGMRHLTTGARPVQAPSDLAGLRLRVPQSDPMIAGFRAFGADPAPLAFPALFGALQSGRFQGQENPVGVIVASRFDQVQRHLAMTGHVYSAAVVLIAPAVAAELSPRAMLAIAEAARLAAAESRRVAGDQERTGVERLRRAGMEVTAPDRRLFAAAVASLRPQFEERYGAALLRRIEETRS